MNLWQSFRAWRRRRRNAAIRRRMTKLGHYHYS